MWLLLRVGASRGRQGDGGRLGGDGCLWASCRQPFRPDDFLVIVHGFGGIESRYVPRVLYFGQVSSCKIGVLFDAIRIRRLFRLPDDCQPLLALLGKRQLLLVEGSETGRALILDALSREDSLTALGGHLDLRRFVRTSLNLIA